MNLDTDKLVEEAELLAEGRHGKILYIDHDDIELILKQQKHEKATTMIHKEWIFTKKAYNAGVAPKPLLLDKKNNVFIREYVRGARLEYVVKMNKQDTSYLQSLFESILDMCRSLENKKIYKPELTYPRKDILVTKNDTPVFIDFERCTVSDKNKNVTQFAQYILRCDHVLPTKNEKEKVYELGKEYAHSPTQETYNAFKMHLLSLL